MLLFRSSLPTVPRISVYTTTLLTEQESVSRPQSSVVSQVIELLTRFTIVLGLLFMKDSILFIHGTDSAGYERAMRAFPLRTGVPNPEWIVLGPQVDILSIGGILGAG